MTTFPAHTTGEPLAPVRAGAGSAERLLLRRVAGAAAAFVALGVLVLVGLAPPEEMWGWAVLAATAALGAGVALTLSRRSLPPLWLHASSLALIAGLCAIDASAGADPPYRQLILLQLVSVCVIHAPRRAGLALLLAALGLLAPVAERGWPLDDVLEWATRAVVWSLCGTMAVVWASSARAQRTALYALARVDSLTGLGNRRAFDEALGREIARAHRTASPLAIALGDVDHFKAINDRVGHTAGDRVLQDVAAALRGSDLCFRWAGDEFALIFPGADVSEARAAAARVADSLEIGISFGCAELAPGMGAIELLEAADRALRERKLAR